MTKRALLAFVLMAVPAAAQETYSVGPASAANVATLTAVLTAKNGDNCARNSLPRTCTQAQVCGVISPNGSGCTAAQARSQGIRIYPLTLAGREEFVTHGLTLPKFNELVDQQQAEDKRAGCAAWNALTQGQRDTVCTTTLGLAAGCNLGCQ